jgi:hypothetical protein
LGTVKNCFTTCHRRVKTNVWGARANKSDCVLSSFNRLAFSMRGWDLLLSVGRGGNLWISVSDDLF